ncbi:MAG: family 4C encapsulin nanocompartment shell protein [Rhodothermales bacterium]
MTILEYSPPEDEILDFINDRIRELRDAEAEAKCILVGPRAYRRMRRAMAQRFKRSEGVFETYNYVPIVVDPSRTDTVCVLPAPATAAEQARIFRIDE